MVTSWYMHCGRSKEINETSYAIRACASCFPGLYKELEECDKSGV